MSTASPILGIPMPDADLMRNAFPAALQDALIKFERYLTFRFFDAGERDAKLPQPLRNMRCRLSSPGVEQTYDGTKWVTTGPWRIEADRIKFTERGYDGSNTYDLATKTITRQEPFVVSVDVALLTNLPGTGAQLLINQTGAGDDQTRARAALPATGDAARHVNIAMPTGGSVTVKAALSVPADIRVQVYNDVHSYLETLVLPLGMTL